MFNQIIHPNRFVLSAMLMFGFLFLTTKVQGQKKEVINGTTYYVHIVEQGHTVYGISKQYAVDINVVYENNPDASDGLTIGEKVLIPFSEVSNKEFRSAPKLKPQGLVHKVKKKETLYAISNKYNVDINELIARNPGAESGIVKGDILIIPVEMVEGKNEVDLKPAEPLGPDKHLVVKQETLYGIAQQHNVTIDELREANDGLVGGLQIGEVITIPSKLNPTIPVERDPNEPIEVEGDLVEEINIGLLLPFSFSLVDSTSMPNTGKNIFKMTDIALEFHRGVQIALEEQMGLNVNLFVYDITKEEAGIKKFLLRTEIDELDIIIGPLHGSAFKRISAALKSSDVHIISPLTNAVGVIANNPSCSKINPSNISHVRYMADMTYPRVKTSQLIVIDSQLDKDKPLLDEYISSYKKLSGGISPTVVQLSKYNQQDLVKALVSEVPNLLVVPSVDKPFVSDFFTRLNDEAMEDYDMQLYGIEPWIEFDNISADQKNKWNLRISTSKYLNYEGKETRKFLEKYYKEFNTIPIAQGYGLLAYDITKFYLDGIYDYGKVFLDHLDQGSSDGILTGFDFKKLPKGGWENNYNFMLRYDSYDLVRDKMETEEME